MAPAADMPKEGALDEQPINFVVFSGTDDKLQALAVMTAGAAALGKQVNIFLQYWGLDAFSKARIDADHGLAPEAGAEGRAKVDALAAAGQASWAETLRQAKDLGEVDIQACSLSMDILGLEESDLDPLVDGLEGVTAFYLNAGDGQIVFI
jgi:peroxiredoxin family protein